MTPRYHLTLTLLLLTLHAATGGRAAGAVPKKECEKKDIAALRERVHYDIENLATYVAPVPARLSIPEGTRIETGARIRLPPRPEPLNVMRVSPETGCFEMVDALGRRRYFRKAGENEIEEIGIEKTPFRAPQPPVQAPPPRDFVLEKKPTAALVESLTENQLEASATNRRTPTERKIRSNVSAANEKMVTRLKAGTAITVETFNDWHETLVDGTLPPAAQHIGGVLRGTKKEKVVDGKAITVDMTNKVGGVGDPAQGTSVELTPPSRVTEKLTALTARVNALDSRSTFSEVAAIYRDFILIHPYGDGNGRVSRVLLDYCLMKTGHRPLPHRYSMTRNVLFRSQAELEQGLTDAYSFAD